MSEQQGEGAKRSRAAPARDTLPRISVANREEMALVLLRHHPMLRDSGSADGSFVITGGEVSIAGGPLLGATLSGKLNWRRVGVAAQVALSSRTITASSEGSTVAVTLGTVTVAGESATAFVWTD